MELAGVAVALGSMMYLISKSVSMGLALLIGTGIAGLFAGLGLQGFITTVSQAVVSPMTLELVVAVILASGLGKAMKESGDLTLMVDSLIAIFPNPKILSMMLPGLMGTLNVPGGAIMSTPMVEENGKLLGLDATTKSAVNVFSRHIGYYVYPLYTSTIILSQLLGIQKLVLIRHNVLPMLVGITLAYYFFFRRVTCDKIALEEDYNKLYYAKNFLLGFLPILVALGLVLVFDLPFYQAIAIGLVIALLRGLPSDGRFGALMARIGMLFRRWIDYRLALTVLGLMMFKAVIEASGAVSSLAESLLSIGIPLPMMVLVLGLLTSYLAGAHMAASGILAALFAPLFPPESLGAYTSLLFAAITLGYLVSPIHLCLVLTNQYFGVRYGEILRKLALPVVGMLATALLQFILLVS